jgi:hypothetical protein
MYTIESKMVIIFCAYNLISSEHFLVSVLDTSKRVFVASLEMHEPIMVVLEALQEIVVQIDTQSTIFCWFQQIWENNCETNPLWHPNQQSEHLSVYFNRGR